MSEETTQEVDLNDPNLDERDRSFLEMQKLFEEMSFRERMRKMMAGLKMPHDTGEYKFARLQLQRPALRQQVVHFPAQARGRGQLFLPAGDLQPPGGERLQQRRREMPAYTFLSAAAPAGQRLVRPQADDEPVLPADGIDELSFFRPHGADGILPQQLLRRGIFLLPCCPGDDCPFFHPFFPSSGASRSVVTPFATYPRHMSRRFWKRSALPILKYASKR